MKATLTPTWELSTEHAACSHGQPVFVHRATGIAYKPGDILEAYGGWGLIPARRVVTRLARLVRLEAEGRALVAGFVGSLPPR